MKKPETKTLKPTTHKTLIRQLFTIQNFEKKRTQSYNTPPHTHKNTAILTKKTQMFRVFHDKKNIYEMFFLFNNTLFPVLAIDIGFAFLPI
ncbi:hypothetical protein F7U78_24370 [Vibrio parahaemolyticus]|nr:hypothetical protein [Vibrio parahaemolyticus]